MSKHLKSDPQAEAVLRRIIRAWKVKIRRALEPGSSFNFWHVIEATPESLYAYIRSRMLRGMCWANYGTRWEMQAVHKLEVTDLESLYRKFNHTNFVPFWPEPKAKPVVRKRREATV